MSGATPQAQAARLGDGVSTGMPQLLALRGAAQGIALRPRRGALATRSGGHLSRFRGRGMEFDEARIYQPGDEVRHMDWRVTARTGHPHVKLFREERERPVWLLVDQGPGMQFGTRVAFKSVVAARAAALLAWAATDQGDRVGALVFAGAQHRELPPRSRSHGVLPLLKTLTLAPQGDEDGALEGALIRLVRLVRPGSLVFVLSDFAELDRRVERHLSRLARHNELLLLRIFDPLEAEAPPPGRYPVGDGTRVSVIDTRDPALREEYAQGFHGRGRRLEQLARSERAHLISLATNDPVADTLVRALNPEAARGGAS